MDIEYSSIVNNVCGESDDRLGNHGASSACNEATLADAVTICDAAGARLCSVDEIGSGATAGTGCGFDTAYTWTSTWCGLGPEGGKYYVDIGGGVVTGNACGESDKAFKKGLDKCFTWKNHPDAERKCLKLGGRMCSQADIEAGVGKATGCGFDSSFLWTSTPCSGGYIQAKGDGDGATQCAATKSKGPMRCCSDVIIL
eukprot:gene12500-30478_t